jgi:aspartyl-tRNA(Asn)/glutamyl-tRNA(Gln) amidotransferase subunit C
MSNLSTDDVRHIATLARLHITDEEAEIYSKELSSILEFVDALQEVDTSGVEPLSQSTDSVNSFREDTIVTQQTPGAEMLQCSPLPIIDHQIQTPSAHN